MAGGAASDFSKLPHPHRPERTRLLLPLGIWYWRTAENAAAKNAGAALGRCICGRATGAQLRSSDRTRPTLPRRIHHRWLAQRRPVVLVASKERRLSVEGRPARNRLAAELRTDRTE